jgi:hypothetical protein
MSFAVIRQFGKILQNLDAILDKATRYAESRKFDVNNFCAMRLAPDMLPFTRQVQIVSDVAKGAAARLSGKDVPRWEDTETTFPELRERIRKTHAYLETFKPEDFAGDPKRHVKIAYPAGKAMEAEDMLLSGSVPNFYFHVAMAYAILRAGGVDLGKADFLGELRMFDA